jgi:hypothetical protein
MKPRRIKISDIPTDMKLSDEDLKKISGGRGAAPPPPPVATTYPVQEQMNLASYRLAQLEAAISKQRF